MDSKIIKYTLILVLFNFKVYAIEFSGKFIQGHFILGKTDPGSKILGHRDTGNTSKTCPNFDVDIWCKDRNL